MWNKDSTKHLSTWECALSSGRGVPVQVKVSRVSLLSNVHVRKSCMLCVKHTCESVCVSERTSYNYKIYKFNSRREFMDLADQTSYNSYRLIGYDLLIDANLKVNLVTHVIYHLYNAEWKTLNVIIDQWYQPLNVITFQKFQSPKITNCNLNLFSYT